MSRHLSDSDPSPDIAAARACDCCIICGQPSGGRDLCIGCYSVIGDTSDLPATDVAQLRARIQSVKERN